MIARMGGELTKRAKRKEMERRAKVEAKAELQSSGEEEEEAEDTQIDMNASDVKKEEGSDDDDDDEEGGDEKKESAGEEKEYDPQKPEPGEVRDFDPIEHPEFGEHEHKQPGKNITTKYQSGAPHGSTHRCGKFCKHGHKHKRQGSWTDGMPK